MSATGTTAPNLASAQRAASPSRAYLACLFGLVAFFAIACIELTWHTGRIAGIWLSNAFILAAVLKHRRRDWTVLLATGGLACFSAGIIMGDPFVRAFAAATVNIAEVLVVAVPMRVLRLDRDFTRTQSLIPFYLLAAAPAPLIASAMAATYFHFAEGASFWNILYSWFGGDALGLIMLVPPLLTVRAKAIREMFSRDQWLESVALIGAMLSLVAINYFYKEYPFAFLFFPVVLLMTFKRGFAGGSIGLLIAGIYMIVPVLYGDASSALRMHNMRVQMDIVQIFVAVIGFSVVLVGAALEERKRLEQWLASAMARAENSREEALVAKDAAERANRSKSMFLANMSHELRTPLNAVIGFSEMMHTEVFGPLGDRRYQEYSNLIQGAGQHLLELINDILDMSKIEAGKQELHREELDVAELVNECAELMRDQAVASHITLGVEIAPAMGSVNADRRSMKQILLNLLSNAVKFTPPGGSVVISARAEGGRTMISVRDTGVGIPAEQIYRLGNPFVQIRNNAGTSQNGTGLGLALVRALTEMHDGTFKIESLEGHGTTVSVSLPNASAAKLAA